MAGGHHCRRFVLASIVAFVFVRSACSCESDAPPIFACEAAGGRKFIEICAATPIDEGDGYLLYRFGSLTAGGEEKTVELEYPRERTGSHRKFFGATYTNKGVYTQSVRFAVGEYGYTVFTRARGSQDLGAGVQVRHSRTGKISTVDCSERPRFYIFELKTILACDSDTPVGKACIQ